MQWIATFALLSWGPASALIFAVMPPRRAVVTSAVAAWLFLPVATLPLPGLPDLTKATVPMVGLLGGALLFDGAGLRRFRLGLWDLPMAVWCVCPLASSLSNGLGLHDGVSGLLAHALGWGLPYFIGRTYLSSLEGLRELAFGVIIGGLVYVPFCLLEMRLSPQLHLNLYGTMTSDFSQSMRYGGYRPQVFLRHGLELGMWMCVASLTAWHLWTSGAVKRLAGFGFGNVWLPVLLVTTVFCKSVGALVLLVVGAALLWACRRRAGVVVLGALILGPPGYAVLRTSGAWGGKELVDLSAVVLGQDRSDSLAFRIRNEDMLMDKALLRPAFGWGGWGRARIYDERGNDICITDGFWIITLGNFGIIGLAALNGLTLAPVVRLGLTHPPGTWRRSQVAPAAVLGVALLLFAIDNISNGMFNPIYLLAAGALSGLPAGGGRAGPGLTPAATREVHRAAAAGLRAECAWEALARAEPGADRGLQADAEGAWSAAAAAARHDLSRGPLDTVGRRTLAFCLEERARYLVRLGRPREAAEARQEALGLRASLAADSPHDDAAVGQWADGLNDLAWVLAAVAVAGPRAHGLAARLAARAVSCRPDHPCYWNTLALAFARVGEHPLAADAARRGITLRGDATPSDHLVLALVYLEKGDLVRAAAAGDLAAEAFLARPFDHPSARWLRAEVEGRLRAGRPAEAAAV